MDKEILKQYKIKFFTRSFNLKLYTYSKGLYQDEGFPIVRLTDQTADGYFYTMLKDKDCDIAINVDEDAFIVNTDTLWELVGYVIENCYANAGCPDGGGWTTRNANPIITNPFFNVFNLKKIREKFSKEEIKHFDYQSVKKTLIERYPQDVMARPGDFERYDYEPYCNFFFWTAYNFQTLYLPTIRHEDGISTILLNHNGEVICMHSWYARFYNVPSFFVKFFQKNADMQKQRINNLIAETYEKRNLPMPEFSFWNKLTFVIDRIVRWCIKVPQRMAGWPKKLKKKFKKMRTK